MAQSCSYNYDYGLKSDQVKRKCHESESGSKRFHKQPPICPKPTKRTQCCPEPPRPSKRTQMNHPEGYLTVCPRHYEDRQTARTSKRSLFGAPSDSEDLDMPSVDSDIGMLTGNRWDINKLANAGKTVSVVTTSSNGEVHEVVKNRRLGVGDDGRPTRITTTTTTKYSVRPKPDKRGTSNDDFMRQPPVKRRGGRGAYAETQSFADIDDMTTRLDRMMRH